MDELAYRAASFLDERLLEPGVSVVRASWADLTAASPLAPCAHMIFHIGHVGSTLLSRLVGEHPALFSVREPALIRGPSMGIAAPPLAEQVRVFARVWRDSETAVIKVTSFVSEYGREMMASARGKVLLLAVTPPVYLRTILAGANSLQEAARLAPWRQRRLERRLGRPVHVTEAGQLIAMTWLSEMLSLADIASYAPDRCLWLDFERFLAEPLAGLTSILEHFGAAWSPLAAEALVDGPLMKRYAKDPKHGYDAALRRDVLERAAQVHASGLRAGMDWLGALMREHDVVREALERSAAMSRKFVEPGVA